MAKVFSLNFFIFEEIITGVTILQRLKKVVFMYSKAKELKKPRGVTNEKNGGSNVASIHRYWFLSMVIDVRINFD